LQGYDRLFGAFFTNVEISTNRPTSTSWKIGNQQLINHGAFFQLMPDGVRMIEVGHLEKLLEVIGGLPRLAHEVALGGGNENLVEIIGLLVIVALITARCNYNSLGSPLCPPLVAFAPPLRAPAGYLSGAAHCSTSKQSSKSVQTLHPCFPRRKPKSTANNHPQ
jgi:hypothetical protein